MSAHRSPARPNYPGNYKEGELAKGGGTPRGHDEVAKKVSVGWDELKHGPSLHEDQHSHGSQGTGAHDAMMDDHSGHGPSPGSPGHHVTSHLEGVESRKLRKNWP